MNFGRKALHRPDYLARAEARFRSPFINTEKIAKGDRSFQLFFCNYS
jgi:hypothetical protein